MNRSVFYPLLLLILAGTLLSACRVKQAGKTGLDAQFVDENLQSAIAQYKVMMEGLPDDRLPKSYTAAQDELVTSGSGSWTSGFYPGTLLLLYEFSKDESLLEEAKKKLAIIEKEKNNRGTHDLGFMLYCSFGNALRLTGDTAYKKVLLTGAGSLSSRFDPEVGCIKSWDHNGDKWKFPVIIDNMMNLEFLSWASRESGNPEYLDIALNHANTTIENHFRPDNSSWHVVDYDPETGEVRGKQTHQGAADESAWARGQAWGLYGYTMMYRETEKKPYLDQAKKIAAFMLKHPNLPEDGIPYWDFDAPGIPDTYRDASAGAIMASALLELNHITGDREYLAAAEKMIRSLSGEKYKAPVGENGGFILLHSVGHLPGNSEVDVPLSYADYYYIEALMRYKKWFLEK
ncbi:glycosyl hydrolase family 88 [Anseongella ginsenosidimutans]|uniref:Glycosyl hydrolase family 88 n=1 Tax=Anseongella ginsenosidimutans TaxID=496056 RepID=A0A4R3KQM6_9SPHI|nr:glycoside hydrolase family 88 protein [Anseongella ginsenosidimutans]QEC52598.1 glucuronyl hydrolase [Anseongella ginsenosidimutans]TCS86519.1 glycosyl hydrolase family 88 [Anseongella ginsenosidimutans]